MRTGSIDILGFKLKYLIEGEGEPILVVGSTIYYPRYGVLYIINNKGGLEKVKFWAEKLLVI